MKLTPYHAKYFAFELTKRNSSDNPEKLAASLLDAQVVLTPHQVDAALFAFKSPLSRGAILADEVGLGKTIEAGLVISQKWAERKRKILIIVPSTLRKQWNQELLDKFFIPSIILESHSFNEEIKNGNSKPFEQQDKIIICSFHFARAKEHDIKLITWDLVVIDEAHHLRNVYKPSNKIASAVKKAVENAPKILLTATPLQNSLLELYGLVSIIDERIFGDLESFKDQFSRLEGDFYFNDLKSRLKYVCQRTLRRQVVEYIKFTNRSAITETFIPLPEEQELYDLVSGYLQGDTLYALPSSHRQLITLILRRLLASSTFAISGIDIGETTGEILKAAVERKIGNVLQANAARNAAFFEEEMEKLDKWAEDRKSSLELKLKELDKNIRTHKTEARKTLVLEEKIKKQREIKELEKKRNIMRRELYDSQDEIDREKETLIKETEDRLKQSSSREELFTIRWRLV
jgi:hypothetical protein